MALSIAPFGAPVPDPEEVEPYNLQENREKVQKWNSLQADSAQKRRPYETRWKEGLGLWTGAHWPTRRPSYRSSHVSNYVFASIETALPIMTDDSPTIYVKPRGPEDAEAAKILEEVVAYIWERQLCDERLVELCRGSLMIGTWAWKVIFDETIGAFGDVRVTCIPPTNLYPDPNATNLENAQWIIHKTSIPINVALRRYPNSKRAILEGCGDKELLRQWTTEAMAQTEQDGSKLGYVVTAPGEAASTTATSYTKDSRPDMPSAGTVTIRECWYLTPAGMMVDTIVGEFCDSTRPSPYMDGKFPFVIYRDYERPDEFWGVGEPENLKLIQLGYNKTMSNVIDNATLMTNSVWVVERNSCDVDKLTNQPGQVVEYSPDRPKPERVPGTPLPSFVTEILDRLKSDFDQVSGINDVTQGRKPAGITAGVAIESLQEAANKRIGLKIRLLESFLAKVGRLLVSRVQQFYMEDRVIRITGAGGEFSFLNVSPDEIQGQFDVVAKAGASLATSQAQKFQQASLLFDRIVKLDPAVAAKMIFKNADIPDKDALLQELLQRLQVQEQMAQQQAAQQAQAAQAQQQQAMQAEQMKAQREQANRESDQGQQMAMQAMKGEQQMQVAQMRPQMQGAR